MDHFGSTEISNLFMLGLALITGLSSTLLGLKGVLQENNTQ
jgi:hypothetical protein